MLIMWLAWAIALAIIGFKPKKKENVSRAAVLLAAVVMTVVYLMPLLNAPQSSVGFRYWMPHQKSAR